MQCNWSSRANLLLRRTLFREHTQSLTLTCQRNRLTHTLPLSSRPGLIPPHKPSTLPRCSSHYHALLVSRLQISSSFSSTATAVSSKLPDDPPPPPYLPTSLPSPSLAPSSESVTSGPLQPTAEPNASEARPRMTSAQMSRVSAHAVRLSVRSGAVMDAVFILNSLYRSIEEKLGDFAPLEDIGPMPEGFTEIAYSRAVSPRLSNHAFLHAMIRSGHAARAARLAELMMARGTRMQPRTLEALIGALCANPQDKLKAKALHFASIAREGPRPPMLEMNAELVQDPTIRAAIRILQSARNYSQRRTEHMYATIVKFCILQGEILFGCLLFVMLVKDWQSRQAILADEYPIPSGEQVPAEQATRTLRMRRFDNNAMQPKLSTMGTVLESIESTFENKPQDTEEEDMFQQALQALACLTSMLEQGLTPFTQLSPLIRVLMACPKVDRKVWIDRYSVPVEVKAYDYFHEILLQIILSLKDPQRPPLKLPPLNRPSYNSLLHYALRHRLSPTLADAILEHMTVKRAKPLKPNVATYNILMRSATILRNSEIANAVLEAFKRDDLNQTIFKDGVTLPASDEAVPYRMRVMQRAFPQAVERSPKKERKEGYDKIAKMIREFDAKPIATIHTVTNYIIHLTATGRPHVVADLVFDLMPELRIVDHPASSPDDYTERKKRSREACIKRVARFGPHFFAALLNALNKAGRTSLAERIWLLAVQAQRASWIPDFVPGGTPWCLSIHAYTSMLQCYVREAHKPMPQIQPTKEDSPDWKPNERTYVRGWARVVLLRQQSANVPRRIAGREMGALLYQSLASGGEEVIAGARHLLAHGQEVGIPPETLPVPDARFFNAALSLLGSDPRIRTQMRPSYYRRKLRFSLSKYSRFGTAEPMPNPLLQHIGEAMVERGFSIPRAYRHLFVGRLPLSDLGDSERPEFDRTPFAYPPLSGARRRTNRIPVVNTRGLPIRRSRKRSQRRINVN